MVNAWKKEVIGKPLPAFVAVSDNGVITNDSLKGKITYINMWAASCAPCMAEMSALNKLYDTLEDNPDFRFISITADNSQTIRRIKETFHIEFTVAHLSEEGCYQIHRGMGYPISIIIDRNSNVRYIHSGGYMDSKEIWQFIFLTDIYPSILRELYP